MNPFLHSLSGSASNRLRLLALACFNWPVCFKARINAQFNRACNLKVVAGFKKQTELYPYKHRSKSPTSLTFSFNGPSNSNAKVLTI